MKSSDRQLPARRPVTLALCAASSRSGGTRSGGAVDAVQIAAGGSKHDRLVSLATIKIEEAGDESAVRAIQKAAHAREAAGLLLTHQKKVDSIYMLDNS